jgi:hypothetical protein
MVLMVVLLLFQNSNDPSTSLRKSPEIDTSPISGSSSTVDQCATHERVYAISHGNNGWGMGNGCTTKQGKEREPKRLSGVHFQRLQRCSPSGAIEFVVIPKVADAVWRETSLATVESGGKW